MCAVRRLALSIVVVVYDMDREVARTLRSLAPDYQRGIDSSDYEVVLVDNGSPRPLAQEMLAAFPGHLRTVRLDPALPSPAHAANVGLEMAEGALVGLLIDGARLVSPGLLEQSTVARRINDRAVIATLAWHLGSEPHMRAKEVGYDQASEDRLLAEIDWESDGYRLFSISTLAGSSRRGWFGALDESNALFMDHSMWTELGGLDENFVLPGGGAVNHDLFRRACALEDSQLVVLLGEGTFHQIHGGALTSRSYPREWALSEYETLRGAALDVPAFAPLYFGTVPAESLPHLEYSVRWAIRDRDRPKN
jgi:glycosyltransferase involved in cell wall biosynthesis